MKIPNTAHVPKEMSSSLQLFLQIRFSLLLWTFSIQSTRQLLCSTMGTHPTFFSYQKRVVPLLPNGCTCKYEFSSANSSKNSPQRTQMKDQLGLSNLLARADGCTAESKLENGFLAEPFAQLFVLPTTGQDHALIPLKYPEFN
jgi:hypothetical protein